jgi:hypothetical protein
MGSCHDVLVFFYSVQHLGAPTSMCIAQCTCISCRKLVFVSFSLHESLKSAQGLCPYAVSFKSLALVDVLQILFLGIFA